MALLATLFSAAVRQRYRTWPYRVLSEPLVAALVLTIPYALLFASSAFMIAAGSVATRLDYALAQLQYAALAFAGEVFIAGVFTQALALTFPSAWGRRLPLLPSPGERSLECSFSVWHGHADHIPVDCFADRRLVGRGFGGAPDVAGSDARQRGTGLAKHSLFSGNRPKPGCATVPDPRLAYSRWSTGVHDSQQADSRRPVF